MGVWGEAQFFVLFEPLKSAATLNRNWATNLRRNIEGCTDASSHVPTQVYGSLVTQTVLPTRSQSKVSNTDIGSAVYEHIFRLEIAVNDVQRMYMSQTFEYLAKEPVEICDLAIVQCQ
jgi:hypothetical protein